MNEAASIAMERKDLPALVKFERVAVEDKPASLKAGRYIAKDVDLVHVIALYGKGDEVIWKIPRWQEHMNTEVKARRMPEAWREEYLKQYHRWLNGQEPSPSGTPIKGWGMFPAQQETLIAANILTVEILAGLTEEGAGRIGMGALDLKRKAIAWLSQMGDKGPLTAKMAALEQENDILKGSVASLERQVQELRTLLPSARPPVEPAPAPESITADDLLSDEEPPVKRGPGRPKREG